MVVSRSSPHASPTSGGAFSISRDDDVVRTRNYGFEKELMALELPRESTRHGIFARILVGFEPRPRCRSLCRRCTGRRSIAWESIVPQSIASGMTFSSLRYAGIPEESS